MLCKCFNFGCFLVHIDTIRSNFRYFLSSQSCQQRRWSTKKLYQDGINKNYWKATQYIKHGVTSWTTASNLPLLLGEVIKCNKSLLQPNKKPIFNSQCTKLNKTFNAASWFEFVTECGGTINLKCETIIIIFVGFITFFLFSLCVYSVHEVSSNDEKKVN